MEVRSLFGLNSASCDLRSAVGGRRTDKASYRVAALRLKMCGFSIGLGGRCEKEFMREVKAREDFLRQMEKDLAEREFKEICR